GGQRRVVFIGLPEKAKIRIYTVAADLVRTLIHEDDESDIEPWDLKNDAGEEVAPGVYIFQVESEGLGSKDGKVMIIK
ncbi:MAG: T9SS C-terminal target domain-containing protein, partial [Candidatus Eisenbacteria sp.]|nr:T9SS C-terminal target domain-containing protein [Candidatus Eisenbacteria bacterium]